MVSTNNAVEVGVLHFFVSLYVTLYDCLNQVGRLDQSCTLRSSTKKKQNKKSIKI